MNVEYERRIDIAAQADRVWGVLSDVERWPQWTASVNGAQLLDAGGLWPGQRARLRQPRLPVTIWTVEQVEHGRMFSWRAEAPGLRSLAEHTVEPKGADSSRIVVRLTHSGILAGPARLIYGGMIRRYLRFEAEGLKRAAETDSGNS
ncbi:MAG TPA: SRPBCC family protein [Kineosporiaceae bacterium]|nr:SRPBCC family protein [Kineosporiaceae bacterium]